MPWCQASDVQLTALSATAVSYSWSTSETSASIEGAPGVSYSVTVYDANGCEASATHTVTGSVNLLSSYVILTKIRVQLTKNTVFSGGLAVTEPNFTAELNSNTLVTAPGTFVHADKIEVNTGSAVSVQIPNPAVVAFPAFEYNPNCSSASSNVTVPDNGIITLNGSVYKNIMIGKNCTVTFTRENIYALNIYVKDNSTIKFADCTRVRICKKLDLGKKVIFNPDTSEVIVFAKDGIDVDGGSKVIADLYTISGRLKVDKATASAPTIMMGLFVANNLHANEYTYWYINPDCDSDCRLTVAVPAAKLDAPVNEEEELSMNPAEVAQVKAYPNPFANVLNIEFSLPEKSRATLEVYSISGQRISVLFEGTADANALYQFQYYPDKAASGMVIYRLQTETGTYFGKAVMVR